MQVPARMCGKPGIDLRMLMRAVVIDDRVDVEMIGYDGLDLAQEAQEFLMAMAWLAGTEHSAGQHIKSSKQCGRTVPLVIVGNSFDVAQTHRQHGLGSFERLTLTLLIDAHDQG